MIDPKLRKLLNSPEKLITVLRDKAYLCDNLTEEDLEILSLILWQLRADSDSSILDQIYDLDYHKRPPTIEEFLTDPYYLGEVCARKEEEDYDGLYPFWKSQLIDDVFSKSSIINQLILGGAIGCVDCDTEYLTPTGWKRVDAYDGGVVAQFNPTTSQAEFVTPEAYVKEPCSEFLHFKTKYGVDQKLSDEHRVYHRSRKGNIWSFLPAKTVAEIHDNNVQGFSGKFKTNYVSPGGAGLQLSDAELRVMVMVIADGSFNKNNILSFNCILNLKKERKVLRARKLLEQAGIQWTEPKAPDGYTRLSFKAPFKKKSFDSDFWKATSDQLSIVAEECVFWDGSESNGQFYTCVRESADFIQHCFSHVGKRARLKIDRRNGRTEYTVITSDNILISLQGTPKTPITRVPSTDGFKYCFTVPTSLLVLRRNGCVFITGNSGKTFTGVIATLFKLSHAMCLRNPLMYYGLAKGTTITCSVFSVTQAQVKRGAFSDMLSFMRLSPFFVDHCKDDIQDKLFANRTIVISDDLQIEAGSKVHEAIGRNTLFSVIDEISHRLEKDAADAAKKLVTSIDRRIKSRFKRGDKNPGFLTVISSANQDTDFLVQYVKDQRKVKTTRIIEPPQWEVHNKVKYTLDGRVFRVDIGDSIRPPRVLDPLEEPVEDARIIEVPEMFRYEFESNLLDALKEIAGVSTGASTKLFGNLKPIFDSLTDDFKNGFKVQEIPLSAGTMINLKDYFDVESYFQMRGQQVSPKRNPTAPRFIHMDMSTGAQDALGICCVHPSSSITVEKFSSVTSRKEFVLRPQWEVDWALRIVRDKGSKDIIDFGKIREFIYWMKNQNVNIQKVSADLLNLSSETLSILDKLGIETKYLSIDRTKEPYKTLRQVFGEGRIKMFAHDHLLLELFNLEDGIKKVDHPEEFSFLLGSGEDDPTPKTTSKVANKGTKDVSDALCGAIFSGEQHESSYYMPDDTTVLDKLRAMSPASRQDADIQLSKEAPVDFASVF